LVLAKSIKTSVLNCIQLICWKFADSSGRSAGSIQVVDQPRKHHWPELQLQQEAATAHDEPPEFAVNSKDYLLWQRIFRTELNKQNLHTATFIYFHKFLF